MWLFGLLLASSLVMGLWDSESRPLDLVVFSIVDGVIIFLFSVPKFRQIASQMVPRSLFTWTAIGYSLVCGILFFIFMSGYIWLARYIGIEVLDDTVFLLTEGWSIWHILIVSSLLPGVLEEIAFRGIIYSGLKRLIRPSSALVVQGAMFSVLHLLPYSFISHFVLGLLLGIVREKSGSLIPGILIHMAWNAYLVLAELQFFL